MVATTQKTKVRCERSRHARGLTPASLAILLALALAMLSGLALSGPAAAEPVLVQNPSFEDWSGGQPLHWKCTHPRGTAETVTWSMGDWVRSGYGSLGMAIRTADANQELNVIQQIPNPVAGATYTFSAYYVTDRRLDAIKMDIFFSGAAGILSWPEVYATSYPPQAGSPWTKISLVATAPPGTKYMFLAFRLYGGMGGTPSTAGGGCVVFDDVTLDATTDKTPPTTTVSGVPTGVTNVPVTLTFAAVDDPGGSGMSGGSAKTEYNLDNKGWVTGKSVTIPAPADHSNDGAHIVQYRSTDAAGNVEAIKSATVTIKGGPLDSVAPTTTVSGMPGGPTNVPVTLTFAAVDNTGGSGMSGGSAKTEYNIDGKGWVTGMSVTIPAPADHSNDGAHIVQYRSTDAAGNVEATKSATIIIDTVAPRTTIGGVPSGSSSAPVTLTFTAADNTGGSGMSGGSAKTEYNIDGKGWVTGTSVTIPAPADQSNNGAHTVQYRSTDAAGNVEATQSVTVTIKAVPPDSTPPTTTVSGLPSGPTNASVTLTFTAIDNAGGSGMSGGSAKTEYNLDGKGWVTGMSVTIPAPADHSGDGSHVVFYRSVDAAGNVETAKNASIDVDTVAPTTTAWNAKGRLRASITLKFEVDHPASASASGIRVVVSDNRGRSVKVFTVGTRSTGVVYSVKWKPRARGTYTYCVYVDADDAGNRQSAVGTAKVLVK